MKQKVCFEGAVGTQRILCNFYLCDRADDASIRFLENLAAVSLPALAQAGEKDAPLSLVDRIASRLEGRYGALTPREREVCARTIAGWSSPAIALDLGIGAGSVLTYRRRAYARYGFSSASDFLERLIN